MANNTSQYNKVRNERRKAQRRIDALQNQYKSAVSPTAKKRLKSQIKSLNAAVEKTYTYSNGKKIRDSKQVSRAYANLIKKNSNLSNYVHSNAAANRAAAIEINKASVGASSTYSESQVHIFYRSTMKAWQNLPAGSDKNKAILDYYGYASLDEAFNDVTSNEQNVNVQKAIDILNNPKDYTDDDRAWAFNFISDNDDDFTISPPNGKDISNLSPVAPM